jgi:hypothetical protein
LQRLNDSFKSVVEKTKKQNDENHKLHDQNKLVNRLKNKIEKKAKKTTAEHKSNKNVISKLEQFGFGYQKTFKDKPVGNLKRKVSLNKKERAKSMIKTKDNLGINYAVIDKENVGFSMNNQRGLKNKKRGTKKYKSVSKTRGISSKMGRLDKKKSGKRLKKSRSSNINNMLRD